MKNNLYVITGGPGVGKTTLINALKNAGYFTIQETARSIIQQQLENGGQALPWKDKELYAFLMLKDSILDYNKATISTQANNVVFFDRGVIDAVCYAEMIGYIFPEPIMKEALKCKYNRKVFILPPWLEIYETDNERKQSWEEAEHTYFQMKATYQKYGYKVLDLPKDTIQNRKEFVLNHITELNHENK